MATSPQFAATPKASAAVLAATADTSRTAPTTVGTVFTAGASGSRIDEVWITAVAASTANQVRLFLFNGTTYYLLREVSITATTPSATVSAFTTTIFFNNLLFS